jgi:hypothetical protein
MESLRKAKTMRDILAFFFVFCVGISPAFSEAQLDFTETHTASFVNAGNPRPFSVPPEISPSGAAQDSKILKPRGYVRFTAGLAKIYLDEPWQFAGGGSLRFHIYDRLSVEPEFIVSSGSRFRQWTIIPNITFDLSDPSKPVAAYVIGGIGFFREFDKYINYTRNEMAWNGGIGVKIRVANRLFLAPEFRIGHISRISSSIGYLF